MKSRRSDFQDVSRAALFVNEALGEVPAAERLAALRDQPILIALGPAAATTRRGQLMLAVAANIVGRLFDFAPVIDVDAGAARVLRGIPGLRPGRGLSAELVAFLESLTPTPGRYRYRAGAQGQSYAVALLIGDAPPSVEACETIWIDGYAWTARVGSASRALGASPGGIFNPFGPMIAAALGAAEIAKSVFRRLSGPARTGSFAPLDGTVTWDLWGHGFDTEGTGPWLPAALDLGGVALAGLGALGSAATMALTQVQGARGNVELVDDDRLSPSNLERMLTARAADIGREKVRVAASAFRGTRLRPIPMATRFDVTALGGSQAEAILVGVDSGAARRQIMNLLPYAIYNGGTQASEFIVSRHVGLEGPCLECLYPESDGRVGRVARQLGVDRTTAAALVSGKRRIDAGILDALERRGGVHFAAVDPGSLLDQPLAALEAYTCSRAVVVEDLPEATISFVSALCGFLMAMEFVKDRVRGARSDPLEPARPVLRLDLLASIPGPWCVEAYVPRRDCFCQHAETRERFAARWGGTTR